MPCSQSKIFLIIAFLIKLNLNVRFHTNTMFDAALQLCISGDLSLCLVVRAVLVASFENCRFASNPFRAVSDKTVTMALAGTVY